MEQWKKIISSDSIYLLIALSILLRMGSFINIMADYDEWTYWQIASEWMSGERLYIDLIDIKPPGIFLVFAFLMKISLHQFWVAKIWSALLLGVASWNVGIIANRIFGVKRLAAGVLFLLSFNYFFGTAMNTEVFYVSCAAIGGALMLSAYNPKRIIGAMFMGFAFCIHYSVAIDMLVAMPFLWIVSGPKSIRSKVLLMVQSGLLFLLLPALIALMFYFNGHLGLLKEVVFELPGKYISKSSNRVLIDSLALYHYRFIWLVIPAYLGLVSLIRKDRALGSVFLVWIIAIWVFILMSARLHQHYWLHLSLPMTLLGSYIVYSSALDKYRHYAYVPVALAILVSAFFHFKKSFEINDSIVSVNFSLPKMQMTDVLWSANGPAVYYTLQGKNCPIAFVHGSLAFDEDHCQVFDHTCESVWKQALDRSNIVVFTHGSDKDDQFLNLIEQDYRKIKQIKNTHSIWIKNSGR